MVAEIETPSSAAFALFVGPTTDLLAPLQFFNGLSTPEIMWIQKVTFQLHVESTWVWDVDAFIDHDCIN